MKGKLLAEIIRKSLALLVIVFGFWHHANATTIVNIGTIDLINKSKLIFEGKVISTRAEANSQGYIYTYVDFQVLDIIAGVVPEGDQLTLRFTGGVIGELALDVGAEIPTVGEHGIYFVESTTIPLVNPLFGWSQGHFTVVNGKVMAGNARPITKVEAMHTETPIRFSGGVAKGIITMDPRSKQRASINSNAQPISIEEFKAAVRSIRE